MEIVGFSYDADTYCKDCTLKYVQDKYPQLSIDSYLDIDDYYGEIVDFEGNSIHPIFETDEALNDVTCGNYVLMKEDIFHDYMIQECNYVTNELWQEVFSDEISLISYRLGSNEDILEVGQLCLEFTTTKYIRELEYRDNSDMWFNHDMMYFFIQKHLDVAITKDQYSYEIVGDRLLLWVELIHNDYRKYKVD